ncbi:unnamed protein product [Prorocentrum cordatum]|uniref:Palmitoyltransferase n=1 Tax=Prorocentrum cordatum TaxID=2364126 RepID=A0ABN9UKB8_9DINO|nr:unnamed protein product [Polarella glacialis]
MSAAYPGRGGAADVAIAVEPLGRAARRLGRALAHPACAEGCAAGGGVFALAGAARALAELAADLGEAGALLGSVVDSCAELALACAACGATAPLARHFQGRALREVMPLALVALIMGTIYFGYIGCCVPLLGTGLSGSAPVAFNVAIALSAWAYHQSVVVDPGGIPESWREAPGVFEQVQYKLLERKKSCESVRFCSKEHKYKPDRSHYCRPLGRNVLRMDHYCPWVVNCIGHFNYKFFVQFLLYTVLANGIALYALIPTLYVQTFPAGSTAFMFGCAGLSGLLTVLLAPFLCFHLWLLGKNLTTIEFCEQMRDSELFASPYDLGILANMQSVFGSNPLLWFLPLGCPLGDGLSWARGPLHDAERRHA